MPAFAEVHNGVVVNHYYFASKPVIDESRVKLVEVPKDNIPPIGAEYKDGHFFSEKMIVFCFFAGI